jgi:hypothetical protein
VFSFMGTIPRGTRSCLVGVLVTYLSSRACCACLGGSRQAILRTSWLCRRTRSTIGSVLSDLEDYDASSCRTYFWW